MGPNRVLGSCGAGVEALFDFRPVQTPPNEHHPALPLLISSPWPTQAAIKEGVHALKHKLLGGVLDMEDPFEPQNVLPSPMQQTLHPLLHLVRVERSVHHHAHRFHMGIVHVVAIFQESGPRLQNLVEAEGVQVEHVGDRHACQLA